MNKLKIGLFIDSFYPMVDGVINVVDTQAKLLSDKCDITVFTVKPRPGKKDTIEHPYKTVKSKILPAYFLDYDLALPGIDKKFKKALNESNLDLVYIHSPSTIAKIGIKYAKKHNIPVMAHLHSQFKRDYYKVTHSKLLTSMLLKSTINIFNKSDLCVAVNSFTKDLYINEYKLKAKTTVVPNATDMKPLENLEEAKKEINEKYNFSPDLKVFTFVGRINKLKNIDLILDSLALLKEKYTNFKFLLIGSGREEKYFIKKINKLKLENHVIMTGKITDKELLKKIYARADLLLFPSHYDTDGLIKFEAAAQKTPTVFVENTGAASQITDNFNGFITKNNANDFCKRIYEVITNNELYQTVSENAYNHLYRTWPESVNEIWNIITELTKSNTKKED